MTPRKSPRLMRSCRKSLRVMNSPCKSSTSVRLEKTPRKSTKSLNSDTGTSPNESAKSVKNYYKVSKTSQSSESDILANEQIPSLKTLEDEVIAVEGVLRANLLPTLPGREEHIEKLDNLLRESINLNQSCSIYIYGAPGRGKTSCVNLVANRTFFKNKMKKVYIDCGKLLKTSDIYEEIICKLNRNKKSTSSTLNITTVKKLIEKGNKRTLLILDEMVSLKTNTNSVLYSLLELRSTVSEGRIAIIGIGNTQNFIDQLPLVKNNSALKPTLMEFASYTKNDIKEIITKRLDLVPLQRLIFTNNAIELLAAKTASFGDARISLGLASAAVREAFNKVEGDDDICKVDPLSVMSAFSLLVSTNEASCEGKDTIDLLPLPHQLIICSVLVVLKKKICAPKDLTLTHVYQQYLQITACKNLEVFSRSDFLYACRVIDMQGIFVRKKVGKKSISWDDKILLKWDPNELMDTLSSKPVLSDIMKN